MLNRTSIEVFFSQFYTRWNQAIEQQACLFMTYDSHKIRSSLCRRTAEGTPLSKYDIHSMASLEKLNRMGSLNE